MEAVILNLGFLNKRINQPQSTQSSPRILSISCFVFDEAIDDRFYPQFLFSLIFW